MCHQSLITSVSPVPNQRFAEPRLVGYARVSTDDQDLSLQIDALTKQSIPTTAIFMDKLSERKPTAPASQSASPRSTAATSWWCGDWTVWDGRCGT